VVPDKLERVYNYHRSTLHTLAELTAAAGLDHPADFHPVHFCRRVSAREVLTFADLYPQLRSGELLIGTNDARFREAWTMARADSFMRRCKSRRVGDSPWFLAPRCRRIIGAFARQERLLHRILRCGTEYLRLTCEAVGSGLRLCRTGSRKLATRRRPRPSPPRDGARPPLVVGMILAGVLLASCSSSPDTSFSIFVDPGKYHTTIACRSPAR